MSCLVDTQRYFPPDSLPELFSIQPTGIFYFSIGHVFWIANDSLRIFDARTKEHPCVVIDLETIDGILTGYVAVLSSKITGDNECTSVNQFTIATIAPSKYRYLGMITPASLAKVKNASSGKTIVGMSNQPPILSPLMDERKKQLQNKKKAAKFVAYYRGAEEMRMTVWRHPVG